MAYEQMTADMVRRVDALTAECAALRKDAERYRWLRDSPRADVRIIGVGKRTGAELDAALDSIPSVLGAA